MKKIIIAAALLAASSAGAYAQAEKTIACTTPGFERQCEQIRREWAERDRSSMRQFQMQQEKEAAQQRQIDVEMRRMHEAEARTQVEARKPRNRLQRAYWLYMYARGCHQARQGYVVVWLNDVQLERARNSIKAIEQGVVQEDPSIDPTEEWKRVTEIQPTGVWEHECPRMFNELLALAPSTPMKKDF